MKCFVMYMFGISGSGKSTIACALEKRLKEKGEMNLQNIDGDVLRSEMGNIFGYSIEDRRNYNYAVRTVLKYLHINNISVIITQVGAYKEIRDFIAEAFKDSIIEVYVKCSQEECARRDVKGYYKKIKNGTMQNLNGTDSPFEEPDHCDIVLDTETLSVEECVDVIENYLVVNGFI